MRHGLDIEGKRRFGVDNESKECLRVCERDKYIDINRQNEGK